MKIKQPRVLAATYNPVSRTKMISFLVDFPTCLLAELRTHRILTQGSLYEHSELTDFNLSANSARAIPANKYLQKILDNPFVPIWTKNQSGMNGELIETVNKINKAWLHNLEEGNSGEFCVWKDDFNYLQEFDSADEPVEEDYINEEDYRFNLKRWQEKETEYQNAGSSYSTSFDYEETTLLDSYNTLLYYNVHKQNANRLISPFAYTTCILTGTEWSNFFELRCPKYEIEKKVYLSKKQAQKEIGLDEENLNITDWQSINKSSAQPEFQVIAEMLYDLYQEADWRESKYHIPFEEDIWDNHELGIVGMLNETNSTVETFNDSRFKIYMKVSASMCAKLSFDTQDNKDTLDKHLERADKLKEHKHWEVFSHQAIAMDNEECQLFTKTYLIKDKPESKNGSLINSRGSAENYKDLYKIIEEGICYNLKGFIPQRYILENL